MDGLIKLLKLKRPVYPGAAGLRGADLKSLLPFLLAAAVGLAAALAAGRFHVQYVNAHKEMVQVVVPARDIPPYTVITEADLTTAPVPAGGEDPAAARSAPEVVGRLALYPLYKGEQVRRERLVDPSVVKDRQVISLGIDVARCVGGALQPGNLVDVWWVNDPAVPGTWQLAASDAVVLDLKDSSGKSVVQQQPPALIQQAVAGSQGPSSPPSVVVLAVKNADVPRVVGGASMKSQNVVLAKKYAEGGTQPNVAVQVAPQQQPGAAPGAAAAAGAAAAGGGAGPAGAAAQPPASAAAAGTAAAPAR